MNSTSGQKSGLQDNDGNQIISHIIQKFDYVATLYGHIHYTIFTAQSELINYNS